MVEAWFKATQDGNDKLMAKMLAKQPNLMTARDKDNNTALHSAAAIGHGNVVGLLLAANPALIDVKCDSWTALHYAASSGHDSIVAQLLAANPRSIHEVTISKMTPLHLAASGGYDKVMALLLAACPGLIDARDHGDKTVLHWAAERGNDNLVTQILAVRPGLATAIDIFGHNALHSAICGGQDDLAEMLLAIKPELSHGVSNTGETALHYAIRERCSQQLVAKLWRANPEALHVADKTSQTPFDLAVTLRHSASITLFRGSVCFDELVSAFAKRKNKKKRGDDWPQNACRPEMEKQCESLWVHLNQDVAGLVFEYIGLDPIKRPPRKRAKKRTREEQRRTCSDRVAATNSEAEEE